MRLSTIWHIWGARNRSLLQAKQAEITNTKIQMTSKLQTKRAKFQTRSHCMSSCLGFRMLIIVISLFFGICHLAFPSYETTSGKGFSVQVSGVSEGAFLTPDTRHLNTLRPVSFSIKPAVFQAGGGAHIASHLLRVLRSFSEYPKSPQYISLLCCPKSGAGRLFAYPASDILNGAPG